MPAMDPIDLTGTIDSLRRAGELHEWVARRLGEAFCRLETLQEGT